MKKHPDEKNKTTFRVLNHPGMSNEIHSATTHIGPDGSDLISIDINQHYNDTCAIRSQQLILRDFGVDITQDELIKEAADKGWYDHGTKLVNVGNLLESHGVIVNRMTDANEFNLFHELAQGHKVIVAVHSNELWHKSNMESIRYNFFGGSADHALIVAGIDTSDAHHPTVILTDPGTGEVAKEYPMDQFMDAWKGSGYFMVATQSPAPFYLPQMANFNYELGHIEHVGQYSYEDYVHHYVETGSEDHPPAHHASETGYAHETENQHEPEHQHIDNYGHHSYTPEDPNNAHQDWNHQNENSFHLFYKDDEHHSPNRFDASHSNESHPDEGHSAAGHLM